MARTIPPALLTALLAPEKTLCLCWKAVRQDTTTYGFTDHDVDVTFGGQTYKAASAFTGSAIEDQLGLAVSNVESMAAFSDDAVSDVDLEDGRWDMADITCYAVDWSNPELGNAILISGTMGQVKAGDTAFQAELRSLGQNFSQYVGSLCQENCRSNFFDTGTGLEGGCNFPEPSPVAGTIASIISRTSFAVSAVGSFPDFGKGSLSGGYFAYGTVTALSGPNKGISLEVFTSDSGLNFVMLMPFPEDFLVGDEVQLQIGCDKTLEVCIKNYNNILNFRAEPYVPGTDFVFKVNS